MRMASSSSRSPQAVIGNAKKQSPLCVAHAAWRLARWNGELRVSSTAAEDLVFHMTTALTPTDLRAGHINPPTAF